VPSHHRHARSNYPVRTRGPIPHAAVAAAQTDGISSND
jgi:hypothetical protein